MDQERTRESKCEHPRRWLNGAFVLLAMGALLGKLFIAGVGSGKQPIYIRARPHTSSSIEQGLESDGIQSRRMVVVNDHDKESKSEAKEKEKVAKSEAKKDEKDSESEAKKKDKDSKSEKDKDSKSDAKDKGKEGKSDGKENDEDSKTKAKKENKDTKSEPKKEDKDIKSKSTSKTGDKEEVNANCPACAPKKKSVPDVVIPFFERDLCKLKYTVKSILKNDPHHNLGDVYLMWVSTKSHSDYKDDLNEIIHSIAGKGKRKVLLLDFSPQVLDSKFSGWFAQQVLKLKIASMVTSDHYLVMDAKNTIIRDVTPDMFFTPCHQAKLFTQFNYDEIPKPHAQWYAASARKLNIKDPASLQTYWPASITPMVFHRETVLDLLAYIGEDSRVDTICSGPLCRMFGVYSTKQQDQDHATEFTMYIVFAYAQKNLKCAYSIEQKAQGDSNQMALSLWRGVKGNRKSTIANDLGTVKNMTEGILKPVMFGSQPSALDDMEPEKKKEALKYLTKIYEDAKLFDSSKDSADELVDCVIGKY